MFVGLIVERVVVVARLLDSVCRSLVLILVGNVCEREVEQTYEHEANGDYAGNNAA